MSSLPDRPHRLDSSTVRRVLRLLLWAWLGWLLLGNLALNLGALEAALSRHPERLALRHGPALSLLPGQAWLWRVELAGRNHRLQWRLDAGRGHLRLALLPLLARELRLVNLSATGPLTLEADWLPDDLPPRLPAIEGGRWLRLQGLSARGPLRLRFADVGFAGDVEAELDLRKQLRGGPLSLELALQSLRGDLQDADGLTLMQALSLSGHAELPPHRREDAPGLARLGLLRAHLQGAARLPARGLELDADGRWRLIGAEPAAGEPGQFEIDLGLEDGELLAGSRLQIEQPITGIGAEGEAWSERLQIELAVNDALALTLELPPPPGDLGHISARLRLAGRGLPFACADAAVVPRCRVDFEPAAVLSRLDGELDLRWQFRSLGWLGPLLLPGDWLRLQGAGAVNAGLRIDAGALAPGSWLEVPAIDLELDLLDAHIEGEAHARLDVVAVQPQGSELRLGFIVDQFELREEGADTSPHLRGRDLRLSAQAPGGLFDLHRHLRLQLAFEDAEIPDLGTYQRYLPPRGIEVLGGQGRLSASLQLDADGAIGSGRLGLTTRATRLRFGELEFRGDLALDTTLRGFELERRRFDLGGSRLRLDEVEVLDQARSRGQHWWLRAELPEAVLEWQRPFELEGRLQAEARDIGLLLGLFGPLRDYPAWVPRLLDAGQIELATGLVLGAEGLALNGLHAHNRRFDLHAGLRLGRQPPQGRMLLGMGPLNVGLELDGSKRHWHLRQARQWYGAPQGSADR